MTDFQWLHAALLTAAVVYGGFVIGATLLVMRARRRAERDQIVRAVERDLLDDMRKSGLI
jgi:hypothetical protein